MVGVKGDFNMCLLYRLYYKDQYFIIIFVIRYMKLFLKVKKKKKKRQTVLSVRGKELLARATLGHMADQGRSVSGRQ